MQRIKTSCDKRIIPPPNDDEMEPPSTPPTPSCYNRLRTPPSPTHGAMLTTNEPYGPQRRSARSTLQSNRFSTANISAASKLSTTQQRTTAASPAKAPGRKLSVTNSDAPSTPPASPSMQATLGPSSARVDNNSNFDNGEGHNNLTSLALPASLSSSDMLPTPSKTPTMTPSRKHQRAASLHNTARALNFQPADVNDVMPTSRQGRKQKSALASKMGDSRLDLGRSTRKSSAVFKIYTESHARVPEEDDSQENVFRGRTGSAAISEQECERERHWDSSPSPPPLVRKTAHERTEEQWMEEAAARNEGIIYSL